MFAQNLCRGFPVEHFLRQNEIWRREAFREAIVNGPDESMSSLDFAASHPDSRELQSALVALDGDCAANTCHHIE